MVRVFASVALAASCLSACGGGGSAARTEEAAKTAPASAAKPAESPVCKLFSQAEVARYIGEPVSAPEDAVLGCQWTAADGSGDVTVAVVPAKNHEPPTQSKGYKTLTEPGRAAFVAPYMDGWLAGAITGDEALRVSVAGSGAGEATAVALLKDAVTRHAAPAR